MVRLITLFLVLVGTSTVAEPLYWSAQKGHTTLMILGSVHVGEQSMYPFPKTITKFLKSSNGLIVEADIRKFSPSDLPAPTVKTKDVLNRAETGKLKQISKQLGLNTQILEQSPPWATALTLQISQFRQLGLSPLLGVDSSMMALAEKSHVPILGLETVGFQFSLLTGLPDGGKFLLENTIQQFDKSAEYGQCLIKAWKSGDASVLEDFAQQTSFSKDFDNKFIYSRNKDWVDKLSSHQFLPKKEGRYMVVVGALHLVGKDNVLSLLQRDGFTIKKLSTSQKVHCQI
ncbi:TraB/GumN family protein [Vibrio sp. S4M6]|uniref:TraB/GumN family protein n=1 Tax=Vibrio sinus TaxID=2946865 RepID=UPI00202A0969|nr:TraB/GumN family protein [Vibrio sinus]MCL9782126.1 TraB/GumN family protein [Vibrio sinus]